MGGGARLLTGGAIALAPRVSARRLVVVLVPAVIIGAAVFTALAFVGNSESPTYLGVFQKAAGRHMESVKVTGFTFVSEDVSDKYSVSRFWLRRTVVPSAVSAIAYDGQKIRQDPIGGVPLSRSRFEKQIGWLSLVEKRFPCSLSAFQVANTRASYGLKLSEADRNSVENGTATLVRVVITCGEG